MPNKYVLIKQLTIILCLLTAFSCKHGDLRDHNPPSSIDILQDSILTLRRSLSKFNNDTLLLQSQLNKPEVKSDKIHQLAIYELLSEIYLNNYQFENVIENRKKILELSDSINNPLYRLKALNSLAFDYKQEHSWNEAITYYFKALKLSDELQNTHQFARKEKTSVLSGMGDIYLKLGYPDEALAYFKESYSLGEEFGDKNSVANSLIGMGSAYEHKNIYDSARICNNKAIDMNIEINSRTGIALAFLNLGNLAAKQKNFGESLIFLNSAYETLKSTSDKLNYLDICLALGNVNTHLSNYAAAENYLSEGLQIAKDVNLPYYLQNAHKQFSFFYQSQKKEALAKNNSVLAQNYSDLMNKSLIQTTLFNSYTEYENEKNSKQIDDLKTNYTQSYNRLLFVILIFLCIIFLMIIFFLIYQRIISSKKEKHKTLVELEKLKSDFYKQISFEFKTPITIVSGLVEKLKKSFENNQPNRHLIDLDIISRQSDNLLFLVDEILSVSNISAKNKVQWINDDIIANLKQLYSSFSDFAHSKQINYLFQSNTNVLYMDYSRERLRLIVNSLLSNSISKCEEKGTISLTVKEDEKQEKCTIEFIYNCPAITLSNIADYAESTHKKDIEQSENQKSGIDLAFIKQLVNSMNGNTFVRNIPTNRTAVAIELPIRNNYKTEEISTVQEQSDITKSLPTDLNLNETEDSKKPTVLIADDNRDIIFYLTSLLRDDFNLIVAYDGKEALDLALEKLPDLIITDLLMPKLDGYSLCDQIRNSVMTSHIPIIILTAKTLTDDRIQATKAGADSYLNKPFIEEELKTKISQLLKSRQQLREKYSQVILESSSDNAELKKDANFDFIQRVTDIIHREIKNSGFIPQALADELQISLSQLNRRIKSASGLSCTNYILKVRLNKAQKLLHASQKPIGEIAEDCGFNDFSYFSKSFKKEFGLTPTQFQRMSVVKK